MSGVGQTEDGVEASTSGIMETTMMEGEEYFNPDDAGTWTQKEMSDQLCRICAKPNQYLIPIFEGEGVEHQLEPKIRKHLPIEVSESDDLPLQVCYQCASTLIAWNDLVIACVEADQKLHQMHAQEEEDDKGVEFFDEPVHDSDDGEEPSQPSTSIDTLAPDMQSDTTSHPKRSPGKAKKPKLKMTLVKSPTAGPSGLKSPVKKLISAKPQDSAVAEASERVQQPSHSSFNAFLQEIKLEPSDVRESHFNVQRPKSNTILIHSSGSVMKHEFPCMKCDSVFTRVGDLVRHEKRKHPRIKKLVIKAVGRHNTNDHINNEVVAPNDSYFSRHESDQSDYSNGDEEKQVAKVQYSKSKASLGQETIKSESDDFGDDVESDHSADSLRFGNLVLDVPITNKKKRKSRLSESQLAAIARAKIVVGDRTLFHCDECGKNIMHQFSYLTHLRIHTGEKPFTCHVCGRQFRTASQLVRHVNDVHEGIKKHPCDVCGRMFAHARARNEHRRTHTEERPCVCHVCGKAFRTKASLYVHNTFHMNVFKYQCPHCERQFRRRQELNDHIMIHTGEKPFACGTCAKSFRQRQELKRHLLTHSSEKPYECPTCKQCFSQKRYLRNHSKTHNSMP